ncbi:MAG: hypothetical protein U0694_12290 [Anaerolineae bacterium]
MPEEADYLDMLGNVNKDEWLTIIRNEILNANQTTRLNLAYILNELETLPSDTPLDFRIIGEYADRIRSAADRITTLANAVNAIYDQLAEEQRSKRAAR